MKTCINLNKGRKAAFSLIEVMVAMLLVATIAIAMGGFAVHAKTTRVQARVRRIATIEASSTMQEAIWATMKFESSFARGEVKYLGYEEDGSPMLTDSASPVQWANGGLNFTKKVTITREAVAMGSDLDYGVLEVEVTFADNEKIILTTKELM